MNGLNRRIIRELKAHMGRYFALFIMIALGMYLVVSVAGMAERTIEGTDTYNEKCNLQSGQFTTFIPLSEDIQDELSSEYGKIEEMYNIDVNAQLSSTSKDQSGKSGSDSESNKAGSESKRSSNNKSIIRLFKNRMDINLLMLDEGRAPQSKNEIVLMNLYAQRNNLKVGDTIKLAGEDYKITGLGCIPDYNLPLKNFSDMTADPEHFGIGIVSDEAYESVLKSKKASSEIYTYAYKLKENISSDELKTALEDISLDYKSSGNEFLIEYVDSHYEDKYDLEDALDDLTEGVDDMKDGAEELNDGIKEGSKNFALLKDTPYAGLSEVIDKYDSGSEELLDGINEYKDGVHDFDEEMRDFIDDNMTYEIANLEGFYENKDNPRIASDAASDVILKRMVALVAGIILVMLFAYVISVFIIHQINEESSVIGTLYAMGVRKSTLMAHYITLPTIVTFVAGLVGMLVGFSKIGVDFQMQDSYLYYSLPQMDRVYPLYIIIYCIVMPPVISIIVNLLVIEKKLSKTPLSLIKNEQEGLKMKESGRAGRGFFLNQFTMRQLSREKRSIITVVIGMVVALLIFMIGLNCYVLCNNVKQENLRDINYENMYILKYPMKNVPHDAEACYIKNLSVNYLDYSLDVSIIGIDDDNKYYPYKTSGNQKELVIASSTAEKYDLKIGDDIIMEDSSEDRKYAFIVSDIVDYSIGLTAYMDIDEMRELFGEEEDYFNMLLSDKDLEIEEGRIYSVTTRSDIENAAGIFVDQMMSLIIILMSVSILIFIAVMYLMLNVMIDRAAYGISLVKIFGYRLREVRRVYLDGNFIAVILGACVGIPLVKKIADSIYPYFIANTAMGMNLVFKWFLYGGVIAGVVVVYLMISGLLTIKIKRIIPADVLKNRE